MFVLLLLPLPFTLLVCALVGMCGFEAGDACVDKAYRVLYVRLPNVIRSILLRFCGSWSVTAYDRTNAYLFNSNNCIVQVVYVMSVGGGYSGFIWWVYPMIDNDPMVSSIHKLLTFVGCGGCFYAFYKTSTLDPGTITAATVDAAVDLYDYDGVLYSERTCRTCQFQKPARSKHCRLCDRCVGRFDHHCIWVANCIGHGNYRWFLAFVAGNLVFLLHDALIITALLLRTVIRSELRSAVFVDRATGDRQAATTWLIVTYILHSFKGPVLLLFVCCTFVLVLSGFLLFHMYLCIWANETTNEFGRWREIGTKNIYQRGFLKNIQEVMHPPALHVKRG